MSDAHGPESREQEMRARVEALSERQREILILVAQHYSSKEIAKRLRLSPATIDSHVANALLKLKLPTRREAGALMIQLGYTAGLLDTQDRSPPLNRHHGGNQRTRRHGQAASSKSSIPWLRRRTFGARSGRGFEDGKNGPTREGMSPVLARALLDGFYIIVFFSVMSAVAFGVHWIVIQCEQWHIDSTVLAVLRSVSYLLVGLDAVGVVTATLVLTIRFILAIKRADD
jgi:DNA-binding CsgD family transcriptional regulator